MLNYRFTGNYRADIDGLRAVAVLSIFICPLNSNLLPGGFLGVDIFFVISGHLISLRILQDTDQNTFSVKEFFRRRIKRIIPPMLMMVGITMFISQLILLPEDAVDVAISGVWSVFSAANVHFWLSQDTSYFAESSNTLPLLHLWSLGVEEQFYLLWPLILVLASRMLENSRLLVFCGVAALLSFTLGEYLSPRYPMFAYYMLPTRVGEFLLGTISAITIRQYGQKQLNPGYVTLTALAGLILILFSLVSFSEHLTFPGMRAVAPTGGVALLILAGHFGRSFPTKLLQIGPLVWMGRISYSVYLWHWPLLAFIRYGNVEITFISGLLVMVTTILLAWISYVFIETPCRSSQSGPLSIFIRYLALPGVVLSLSGLAIVVTGGYGFRLGGSEAYKARLSTLRAQKLKPAFLASYVCQRSLLRREDGKDNRFIVGPVNGQSVDVILWGDSNAAHYVGMIGAFAEKEGFRFRNIQHSSCPPLMSDPTAFVKYDNVDKCITSLNIARDAIKSYPVILISANWPGYQSRSEEFLPAFFRTVDYLVSQKKHVVLIGKVPVIDGFDRTCQEKRLGFTFTRCAESAPLHPEIQKVNKTLSEYAQKTSNVDFFEVTSYMCNDLLNCFAKDREGEPLYFDASHLALSGSWRIGEIVIEHSGVPESFQLLSSRSR